MAAKPAATTNEKLPVVKLMLLGDSGVGKSSIMTQFCENHFDSNIISTAGVDFKQKTMDVSGRRLKVNVWDTAGQERFRNITPAYYRNAAGIVLVYDCTDSNSFKNIEHWMGNIRTHSSADVEKILVANKTDMFHIRRISTEAGQELAADYGIPFVEVSAKTNQNIETIFTTLLQNLVKNRGDVLDRLTSPPAVQLDNKAGDSDKKPCCK